ncbi:hypothetical protein MC885_019301 [Smutsia gigantea]|nr:hypothetical protein MC885_019301 [Smutsia gigantea]
MSLGPGARLSLVLTLTAWPQDHGTHFTCQVKLPTSAPKILLTTLCPPVLEGQALRLLCAADSNPVAELSWFQGPPALHATPVSSTETLELPQVELGHEGEFTCQAQNGLGSQHVSLSLSVHHPPCGCWALEGPGAVLQLLPPGPAGPLPALATGGGAAEGELQQRLPDGHLQRPGALGPQLPEAPRAPGSLRLSCEAGNACGAQSSTVLLPGQGAAGR